MTALYIIGGVLLFLLLILAVKIGIRVTYCESPVLTVRVLFIRKSVSAERFAAGEKPEKPEKKKEKKKKKEKPPAEEKSVSDKMEIVKNALARIISQCRRYLFLERCILKARIASDDPAKTALLYGASCSAAGTLFALTNGMKRRSHKKNRFLTEIKPDFISEKPDFFADVELSIRVWQALLLGITALKTYKKLK